MAEQGPYINQVEGIAIAQNTISSVIEDFQESVDTQLDPVITGMQNKVDKTVKINNKSLSTDIVLNKTDIGLSNVDNTSDLNKPISTATQSALNSISSGIGNANPTDIPSASINTYNANSAGTYANFSGVIVTIEDLSAGIVQLRKTGSTWNKIIVPSETLAILKNQTSPVEFSQPVSFLNGGPLDSWEGPYNSIAEACAAIANEVDGNGVNFRLGKKPLIRVNGLLVQHWWNGGFTDKNLVPTISDKNIAADDVLLSKYELVGLPGKDKWNWVDGSSIAGVVPQIGNSPIWYTTTDGFLNIPITLDLTSKFVAVVFECIALKNVINFGEPNTYLRVNGAFRGFTKVKSAKVGNRYLFTGYLDLTTILDTDTVVFTLALHTINRPVSEPIVAELSAVKLFYVDESVVDGVFTVSDVSTKLLAENSSLSTKVAANEISIDNANRKKLDKSEGKNKLDPSAFKYGWFYFAGVNTKTASYNANNAYGHTDFIPVDVAGLITTGAGTSAQGLTSHVVFSANKSWLRSVQNSNQYTYEVGDAHVIFIYQIAGNMSFAKTVAVVPGTVYEFEEYTQNLPLKEVQKDVAKLKTDTSLGASIGKVVNGTPKVYASVATFIATSAAVIVERNIAEDYLVYQKTGAGNIWLLTPNPGFTPSGKGDIRVQFKVEFTKVNTTKGIEVFVAQGTAPAAGKYLRVTKEPIRANGTFDISLDPSWYTVYEGFTNFYIWINNETLEGATSVLTAKLTGLKVLEYENSVNTTNISGSNAKELFESVDKVLTDLKASAADYGDLISASGKRFELTVQDDGTLRSIPIIPATGAFFGNSLIASFGYGMAASQADKDYYYLITEYIKTLNPSFTSTRNGVATYEGITDPANIQPMLESNILNKLTGAEELISFQLGDNVNTPEKNAVFPESALKLLQGVRAKCPNARVVWMGMWYGSAAKYAAIENACALTGCKFISLADLVTEANRSFIGALTKKGIANRTLADVTNLVEHSPTDITVTFTVSTTSYSSRLTVASYSLSAGTLSYRSEYEIISSAGVASHPGDLGMRAIANRFMYEMKLTDQSEFYKATA